MKYLTILALAAVAFGLGACAKKQDTSSSYQATTHSASTGYSK